MAWSPCCQWRAMAIPQGGVLHRRVVRKAGIFLLPPPCTHVLHLPLSLMYFKRKMFAQALSAAAPRCTDKPASQGPGMGEPGIWHSGGRMRCELINSSPGLGEGRHHCCGMQGCRVLCSSIAPKQNVAWMPGWRTLCSSVWAALRCKALYGEQNIFKIFKF